VLLVIDNYDSFTFNLVHYLGELGAVPRVIRNDRITGADRPHLSPTDDRQPIDKTPPSGRGLAALRRAVGPEWATDPDPISFSRRYSAITSLSCSI